MAAKKSAASTTVAAEVTEVEYIVKTTMGFVTVPAEQVEGKSAEELAEWLAKDDYLSRIGAWAVARKTTETLFSRTI